MKKWYCPHCKVFKRFKKTHAGYMGYPDWHTCRCCGTELYNVQEVLEVMVRKRIEDMEVEHGSKYKR
jgi:hypothetical protein